MRVLLTTNIGDTDWGAFRVAGAVQQLPPSEGDVCEVPDIVGAKLVARHWALEIVPEPVPEPVPQPTAEVAKPKAAKAKQEPQLQPSEK